MKAKLATAAVARLHFVRPMRLQSGVALFVFVASVPYVAEDVALQTVRGTRLACEIDVPVTWSIVGMF